jgi:hypothetical protein
MNRRELLSRESASIDTDYRYTQPWNYRHYPDGTSVGTPGQCPARRSLSRWEGFRLRLKGYSPADIREATRCSHYEGHEVYAHKNPSQANHSDSFDVEWPAPTQRKASLIG